MASYIRPCRKGIGATAEDGYHYCRPIHGNLARCIHCSNGGLYGIRKKIEQLSEQKSKKSIVRQKFIRQDTIDCKFGGRMPVFLSIGFLGCLESQQDNGIHGSPTTGRIP